jgi:hypothetical protein
LQVNLDPPLPAEIGVGSGTAVFVHGTFDTEQAIRGLDFFVGREEEPVALRGAPGLDYFRALYTRFDPDATAGRDTDPDAREYPLLHSYGSELWGITRPTISSPGWKRTRS